MSSAPIGERLFEAGLIAKADLLAALALQRQLRRRKLGAVLVECGLVSEEAVEEAAQRKGGSSLGDWLVEQGQLEPGSLEQALDLQRRQRAQRLGDLLVAMGAISRARLEAFLGAEGERTAVV